MSLPTGPIGIVRNNKIFWAHERADGRITTLQKSSKCLATPTCLQSCATKAQTCLETASDTGRHASLAWRWSKNAKLVLARCFDKGYPLAPPQRER